MTRASLPAVFQQWSAMSLMDRLVWKGTDSDAASDDAFCPEQGETS
ncbi:hypothetical protein IHQ71_07185 [Rhizobium sp. TH2]|nr:hypothetical protein [Rhizobium sp. TH2]UVC10381.1 hypothetical protein IHQ71_07185 [Rhizobium sp. TH2]